MKASNLTDRAKRTLGLLPKVVAARPRKRRAKKRVARDGPLSVVLASASAVTILGLRVATTKNSRVHWRAKAARVKFERRSAILACVNMRQPTFPCVVKLTRVGPRKLDANNASETLQAIQDGVADWIGVDDGDETRVLWEYEQEVGSYAVRIEIVEPKEDA
jgi:hypothetical protein